MQAIGSRLVNFCYPTHERYSLSNLLTPFYRRDRPTMEPDFSPNPKDNFKNEFTITDQASFPEHPSEKFKWEHKEEQKPPHTW